MTRLLYGLGGLCVRRRWAVLGVWLVRLRGPGDRCAHASARTSTTTSRSRAATARRRPTCSPSASPRRPTARTRWCSRRRRVRKLTDSKFKQPIDDTIAAFKKDPAVRDATSPLSSQGKDILAKDKRIGYIALNLSASPSELTTDDAERIVGEADPARARRPRRQLRRIRGAEGLEARDPLQRGRRAGHGGDRAAADLRHRGRDGAADHHGHRGACQRPVDHHADQPGRRGADRGADARDDDRARRRHRLRAVHRHPPPGSAARRDGDVASRSRAPPRHRAARSCSPAPRSSSRCSRWRS